LLRKCAQQSIIATLPGPQTAEIDSDQHVAGVATKAARGSHATAPEGWAPSGAEVFAVVLAFIQAFRRLFRSGFEYADPPRNERKQNQGGDPRRGPIRSQFCITVHLGLLPPLVLRPSTGASRRHSGLRNHSRSGEAYF
jgi:hypothetical protein